jgi:hypothetical protein
VSFICRGRQLAGEKTLNRVGKISTAERKKGSPTASDPFLFSGRGEAVQDWVPVASARRAWLLLPCGDSRLIFTEDRSKEPGRLEPCLGVGGGSAAACSLTRAEARRGGNPRAGGGGSSPLGGAWRDRQNGIDQRRGTSLWAVKRRRSSASENNAANVQRPGRGGFKKMAKPR